MILHIMVDDNCRVRSHCGEDISSDEAFWDGSSEIICEMGNTSSVLESLLEITRFPRLAPIGLVLSASPQWTVPIKLLLTGSILNAACGVHASIFLWDMQDMNFRIKVDDNC